MPGTDLNITLPTTGQTQWDGPLNDALQTIIDDIEDKIEASELLLNGDITLTPAGTSYSINGVRSVQLASNATVYLGASNVGRFYRYGSDAYFLDGDGNNVRITANGGLNTTVSGGFTGDYGSSGANASYSSANQQFTFTSSAGVVAKMLMGDLSLRERTSGITNVVTLKSPTSLAASYNITLPATLPAATSVMLLSSAGQVSSTTTVDIDTVIADTITSNLTVTTPELNVTTAIFNGSGTAVQVSDGLHVTGNTTISGTAQVQQAASFLGGIRLGSASAALLSSFDRASWTPTLVFSIGGTPTYNVQEGYYTKVGNWVFVAVNIEQLNILPVAGATITITGLPYTPSYSFAAHYTGAVSCFNLDNTAGNMTCFLKSGSSSIQFRQGNDGDTASGFNWGGGTALKVKLTISYYTAS